MSEHLYNKCWANYRGDCGRGMSKEHLVSKALLPEEKVWVSGFSWCRSEERCIGINALQRRVLCAKHNNALSPADEAGVHAISAFAEGTAEKAVDGPLLERWLLKTAINLSLDGDLHIGVGMADSIPGKPSPYLQAVAFGEQPFLASMGAYFLVPREPYAHRVGEILLVPIHRGGAIGGFLFGLRGQFVFLSLLPGDAPPSIGELVSGVLAPQLAAAPLLYRPRGVQVQTPGREAGEIDIRWA